MKSERPWTASKLDVEKMTRLHDLKNDEPALLHYRKSLYQPTHSRRPLITVETTPIPANIGNLDIIMSCAQRGDPENELRLAQKILNILFEEAAALPDHQAKTEVQ